MEGIERRSGFDPKDFDDETIDNILASVDDEEGVSQAIQLIWGESDGDSEEGGVDAKNGAVLSQVFQFDFDKIGEHLDPAMDAT